MSGWRGRAEYARPRVENAAVEVGKVFNCSSVEKLFHGEVPRGDV